MPVIPNRLDCLAINSKRCAYSAERSTLLVSSGAESPRLVFSGFRPDTPERLIENLLGDRRVQSKQ